MTNKENAKDLALKNYPERLIYGNEYDLNENDRILFEEGAFEMAEWKDEQFVSLARKWFQDNAWSFAHSVDGEPSYDTEMALKSFLEKMNLKD